MYYIVSYCIQHFRIETTAIFEMSWNSLLSVNPIISSFSGGQKSTEELQMLLRCIQMALWMFGVSQTLLTQ